MADLFCLRREGNEDALVEVSIVFDAVSIECKYFDAINTRAEHAFVFGTTTIANKNGVLISC
jgi:hypothetical protein